MCVYKTLKGLGPFYLKDIYSGRFNKRRLCPLYIYKLDIYTVSSLYKKAGKWGNEPGWDYEDSLNFLPLGQTQFELISFRLVIPWEWKVPFLHFAHRSVYVEVIPSGIAARGESSQLLVSVPAQPPYQLLLIKNYQTRAKDMKNVISSVVLDCVGIWRRTSKADLDRLRS